MCQGRSQGPRRISFALGSCYPASYSALPPRFHHPNSTSLPYPSIIEVHKYHQNNVAAPLQVGFRREIINNTLFPQTSLDHFAYHLRKADRVTSGLRSFSHNPMAQVGFASLASPLPSRSNCRCLVNERVRMSILSPIYQPTGGKRVPQS